MENYLSSLPLGQLEGPQSGKYELKSEENRRVDHLAPFSPWRLQADRTQGLPPTYGGENSEVGGWREGLHHLLVDVPEVEPW